MAINNLRRQENHRTVRWFFFYICLALSLALIVHRDILFNMHAFGRHWDWSFYPLSDFYRVYLSTFFYALKPNYLGYYDILSMNLIEVLLKASVLGVFNIVQLASISFINIPVIYKWAIFIVLPLISSIGIWYLCGAVLADLKKTHKRLFFCAALTANLFYTFSLLLIFDLHGGALNRQLSSVFFPYIWAVAYRYATQQSVRHLDYRIITLSLFFAIFDISNIFYFAVILCLLILLKSQPARYKLSHIGILGSLAVLINFYWIHAFFIGNQLQLSSILHGRRPDYLELFPHSASFTDIIFAIKTPHDQITRVFGGHPLLYVPGITLFGGIFLGLLMTRKIRVYIRTYALLISFFFFTVILAGGIHSVGNVHKALYSMPFFSFIGGALRYMPNVLIMEILLFLLSIRVLKEADRIRDYLVYLMLTIPAILWMIFLSTRGSIMKLVYDTMVGPKGTNHEATALYDYDESNYAKIRAERLEYRVLPVPSWYSPIYTGNIYPSTSQGSVIDNFYFGRGMLYTNTTPLFSSEYFKSAIAYPSSMFYSFANAGAIMYGPEIAPIIIKEYTFSEDWTYRSLPEYRDTLSSYARQNKIIKIPSQYFYPQVYAPASLEISSLPSKNMFQFISPDHREAPRGVVLTGQNTSAFVKKLQSRSYRTPVIEYRKISPTKYRISAHEVTETFPLIISTDYAPGWILTARKGRDSKSNGEDLLRKMSNYKVLIGNTDTQATPDELRSYIQKGYISSLGNLKTQSFIHYDYSNEQERPSKTETYTIDYISKIIKGSIQNNNLADDIGDDTVQISSSNHLIMNGFANGWIIDPGTLCKPSTPCDIEFVAEFYPQRYFSMALAITGITIASAACVIIFLKRHEQT